MVTIALVFINTLRKGVRSSVTLLQKAGSAAPAGKGGLWLGFRALALGGPQAVIREHRALGSVFTSGHLGCGDVPRRGGVDPFPPGGEYRWLFGHRAHLWEKSWLKRLDTERSILLPGSSPKLRDFFPWSLDRGKYIFFIT